MSFFGGCRFFTHCDSFSAESGRRDLRSRADGFLARSAIFRGHPAAVRCFPAYRQAAAGFYILHGTAGVYVGVFRDGFSVEQHHRGVAESYRSSPRTVVVLCRDTRKRVLDANIPGNRTALCRCHDAESACDDRSNYGDDERSCKFACIIFIFYS